MRPLSLRLRLTLIYAALSVLVLAGFGALFYRTLAARLERSLDQDLDERAAALRGYLRFPGGRPQLVFDQNDPEEAFFIRTATRYFQVMDAASGEVLIQSRAGRRSRLPRRPASRCRWAAGRCGFDRQRRLWGEFVPDRSAARTTRDAHRGAPGLGPATGGAAS